MFSLKRNQVIITALVVMIAVAGYLNYVDNNNDGDNLTLDDNGEITAMVTYDENGGVIEDSFTEGEIGDALTMDENPTISVEVPVEDLADVNNATNVAEGEGEAVFVNTTDDSSYFVQAKLEREQARSKEQDILLGMINDSKISDEQRAECAEEMLDLQKRIEKETAAEALIEAKGFDEAYVRMDDETVDVVVNKEVLTDAEIAQIEDIVTRKTGMTTEQIRISPMKK